MAFRGSSAIARYKAAARKIKRDRKAGRLAPIPPPAHLSSGTPATMQAVTGEWFVWAPPQAGPPFRPASQLAGPFETREEAERWIAERQP